jgi:DNA repair protein RAD5
MPSIISIMKIASSQDGSSVFHMIDWHRVVLDEAHMIKSPKTKAAQAAYLLSSQCRWCLTGTPLQVCLLVETIIHLS